MTGRELERAPRLPTLPEKMNYARALAGSNLLPKAYRGAPANVLVAVEYGQSLDLPAMTAIQGVHVIEGKPSLSSNLMAALVRRAGHTLRVGFNDGVGWAELIRSDDPEHTFRAEWSWDRAVRAELTKKDNWRKYPESMLKARAVTEVVKEGASEVLHGMVYTPDELGVITNEEGSPIIEGEIVEDQPAEQPTPPREDKGEPVRGKQMKALHAAFRDFGIGGGEQHDAQIAYCVEVIGRDITSKTQLTVVEADAVVARIRADLKNKPAEDEPVDAEIVEDGQTEFDDEAWRRGEEPRLNDPANDGAIDARMEADTDG